jgi:hypothetical protein
MKNPHRPILNMLSLPLHLIPPMPSPLPHLTTTTAHPLLPFLHHNVPFPLPLVLLPLPLPLPSPLSLHLPLIPKLRSEQIGIQRRAPIRAETLFEAANFVPGGLEVECLFLLGWLAMKVVQREYLRRILPVLHGLHLSSYIVPSASLLLSLAY